MDKRYIVPDSLNPNPEVVSKIEEFLKTFKPYEIAQDLSLVLYLDEKSGAYYLICQIHANDLVSSCDLEASLDTTDEDEIYKLNRDITEDPEAYRIMEADAFKGRSFEDMVFEYDTSYRSEKPLKVYGGQHRIQAITKAKEQKGSVVHGIRVYFNLSREQKVEIATVNNTSIAVANDLLDRMREQLLGSELRNWCQTVGLLDKGKDFADRRSPDVPTVRIARTLLVNFHSGRNAQNDDFLQPVVCKSGTLDEAYLQVREKINWSDEKLITMGKKFTLLHKTQRERVLNREEDKIAEFARKTLSLSVVASWAYAAGFFQNNPECLKHHYALPESVKAPDDPLNAKALSQARLKGTDPDTYRGLGTRFNPKELGRMLEVFIVLATKAAEKKITKGLANAAIQSFEAKRATFEANEALGKI